MPPPVKSLPTESLPTKPLPTKPLPTELLVVTSESTAALPSLEVDGFRVLAFKDCQQALQVATERTFDAALVSTNCQHQSEFLNRLSAADGALQVLVLRDPSEDERLGDRRDFDDLPNLHIAPRSTPLAELRWGLRQAAELTRLRRENSLLRRQSRLQTQASEQSDVSDQVQHCSEKQSPPFSIGYAIDLATITRAHVLAVLDQHGGNKARAARSLGINRRSLYRLLEKYDDRQVAN